MPDLCPVSRRASPLRAPASGHHLVLKKRQVRAPLRENPISYPPPQPSSPSLFPAPPSPARTSLSLVPTLSLPGKPPSSLPPAFAASPPPASPACAAPFRHSRHQPAPAIPSSPPSAFPATLQRPRPQPSRQFLRPRPQPAQHSSSASTFSPPLVTLSSA